MRHSRLRGALALLGGLSPGLGAQATPGACPVTGDARAATVQALNVLKNRTVLPEPADVDSQVTLAALLAPGDDRERWDVQRAATLIGLVLAVQPGGLETVNCHAPDLRDRDTHVELVFDSSSVSGPARVIIEVTPRIRAIMAARGIDWSTPALQRHLPHHWIRVTGWLFFDAEHAGQSEHTAPGRSNNWRATAWEIHPVTAIEVVPRPR